MRPFLANPSFGCNLGGGPCPTVPQPCLGDFGSPYWGHLGRQKNTKTFPRLRSGSFFLSFPLCDSSHLCPPSVNSNGDKSGSLGLDQRAARQALMGPAPGIQPAGQALPAKSESCCGCPELLFFGVLDIWMCLFLGSPFLVGLKSRNQKERIQFRALLIIWVSVLREGKRKEPPLAKWHLRMVTFWPPTA